MGTCKQSAQLLVNTNTESANNTTATQYIYCRYLGILNLLAKIQNSKICAYRYKTAWSEKFRKGKSTSLYRKIQNKYPLVQW